MKLFFFNLKQIHWTKLQLNYRYYQYWAPLKKWNLYLLIVMFNWLDIATQFQILWIPKLVQKKIFWHVLDVFSLLSDQIKPIPFHERSAYHGTTLEYHQQGDRSNLKIHFFRIEEGQGNLFWRKKICFGYTEIIDDQMWYWLK